MREIAVEGTIWAIQYITRARWQRIQQIGRDNDLTEDELISLVLEACVVNASRTVVKNMTASCQRTLYEAIMLHSYFIEPQTAPTKIAVSNFCRQRHHPRQHKHSQYLGHWSRLVELVELAWEQRKPGYRDGVILVPVPPGEFRGCVVTLVEGDQLVGTYARRRPFEDPRRSVGVIRDALSLPVPKHVDIVLYSRETLLEDEEAQSLTGADWEIVTILARDELEEQPMPVGTLMANHFGASGGTATRMSPEEFEAALRRSFNYWKTRSTLAERSS